MKWLNKTLNPTRMTPEVRKKLRESRLGTGKTNCYEKMYGRHTHRVIAEQMLGRPLKKGEVVHHIDGDKRNNKPENLMVFDNQSEHAAWHAKYDMDWGW
ncbi:MAG: HNH endonuclease [Clostridiales bacterium]|nr:HNH endonuclease [Clostridiales bacterium]